MKNFVQNGKSLDVVLGADVVSGAPIVVGDMLVIAASNGANGETIAADTCGVFELAKLSTDVIGQGDKVYWDATNEEITVTDTGNTFAGYAAAAAGNSATKVKVLIDRL